MDKIPVTFDFQGKEYRGHLVRVMGMGGTATFYLHMPDDENPNAVWYWGRLRYNEHPSVNGWVFDPTPKTEELAGQAEYFGSVVMSWLDSHN